MDPNTCLMKLLWDLVDFRLNSGRGDQACDVNEFNACIADHLRGRLDREHPDYW